MRWNSFGEYACGWLQTDANEWDIGNDGSSDDGNDGSPVMKTPMHSGNYSHFN